MTISIYLDSGSLADIEMAEKNPLVSGVTTNPSILRKAGVKRYRDFAQQVLNITDKPVSFEVLSDDWAEMEDQAYEIASWGENVYIKIPITNTKGEASIDLIDKLSDLRLNVTAVMTWDQLRALKTVDRPHHIISVFCGRIQDAGYSVPFVKDQGFRAKFLWASTRQTNAIDYAWNGYDIITMTPDLIAKLTLRGKDLKQYSLETVQQFYNDGRGIEF